MGSDASLSLRLLFVVPCFSPVKPLSIFFLPSCYSYRFPFRVVAFLLFAVFAVDSWPL